MTAQFKKLNSGEWGIFTEGFIPQQGDTVTITKKNGEKTQVKVAYVKWCNTEEQKAICSIEQPKSFGHLRRTKNRKRCPMCGSPRCDGAYGYLCDED